MCFLCCWDLDLLLMLSLLLCFLTRKMWEKVKRLKLFAFFLKKIYGKRCLIELIEQALLGYLELIYLFSQV